MGLIYFSDASSFAEAPMDALALFLSDLETRAPLSSWSIIGVCGDGRMCVARDDPDFPGDEEQRRTRAYFDLTDGTFYICGVIPTEEGDTVMGEYAWYVQWKEQCELISGTLNRRGDR